jgi:ribosomal-protein-alanine N-acetyltransferase
MNYRIDDIVLRKPEPSDLETLYQQKNDPEIARMLGGFSAGYSMADLHDWLEYHRAREDEALWVITGAESSRCIGHVGLYKIDHRIRSAEFGILIGDRSAWGRGVGRACTRFVLDYGFLELNLNRIYLEVLATNERAINLYRSLGFKDEGRLREAQYKAGKYVDVLIMGFLRSEYVHDAFG